MVQRIRANVAALERQVAIARRGSGDATAAGLAAKSNRYTDLLRDLQSAQTLYQAYTRYLEGAAGGNESADWTVQALQGAYLRRGIHPNRVPLGLAILVALALVACEVYLLAPGRTRAPRTAPQPT